MTKPAARTSNTTRVRRCANCSRNKERERKNHGDLRQFRAVCCGQFMGESDVTIWNRHDGNFGQHHPHLRVNQGFHLGSFFVILGQRAGLHGFNHLLKLGATLSDGFGQQSFALPVEPCLRCQRRGQKNAEQQGGEDKEAGKAGHAANGERVTVLTTGH